MKIRRRDLKIYRRYKGDEQVFKSSASGKELAQLAEDKFEQIHILVKNEVPILKNLASVEEINQQQELRRKHLVRPGLKFLLKRIARELHISTNANDYNSGNFISDLIDLFTGNTRY